MTINCRFICLFRNSCCRADVSGSTRAGIVITITSAVSVNNILTGLIRNVSAAAAAVAVAVMRAVIMSAGDGFAIKIATETLNHQVITVLSTSIRSYVAV